MNTRKSQAWIVALVFGTLLVACGGPTVTPTPVPPTVTSIPSTATPVPPTATPVPPTTTPLPLSATPVPPSPTPVTVPPKTIQGVLLDGKSDAPLTGQFDVVVGWGFAKDSRRPVGLKGNLLFIGGKSEGKLVAGENGEFVLQDVESFGIDNA
jgi:hypothetical protein